MKKDGLHQGGGQFDTQKVISANIPKSGVIQKAIPYLIKKKFVPMESDAVNIAKYTKEDEPDKYLHNFKQSMDNKRLYRI